MRTKRILMSILLLLVTFSLVACGKVTVKLSGDAQVKVGQTINLTPEASKKGATFTWASSNDAVATVKDGAVTGVSAGKVTITVTAKSGKKTGEASLEITVVASNKPVISGADDVQILKGERFAPMDGVTARDEEDGDLTNQIDIQGSVNYNLVGEYTVTYTVRDNEGNVTTVVRKVTVVANDTDAPLLTGTQNKTIVIGDAAFKLTDNVSANDAIDGDVSANIQVSGELNIWKLGDYEIKYSVKDAAGNEAKATRIITVGLGEFQFEELADKEFTKEGNDYQFAVALESINTQLADFALAKLSFKVNAAAACELVPSITNGTAQAKVELAAGDNEITIYFRVNSAIAEGALKLAAPADATLTFSEVKFAFAEAKDVTAPVINVPEGKIVLPADVDDLNVLKGFILNGVTAQDNVDMVMNSKLDVDMTGIAAGTYEEKQVTIFAIDTAGNRGEATRTVEFAKAYSTNLIADPTFSTDSRYEEGTTDPIWEHWRLHGGAGDPEMYIADGVLVHHNRSTDAPGYDSASCPIIDTDSTVLEGGNWYMLKFDVKAAVARQMTVRIGLAAEAPVWLENFAGASNYPLNVSTEFETKYVVFYVHANASADGYTGISCELKNGTFEWNSEKEIGNTFYFDNLQFYLLSNQNAAPTLKINGELPTTFGKGQEKPDLTKYVIAYDREDARNIEITAANITESIDMATAGTYDVVYKVADSEGAESTITLKIKVLDEADTAAPVLAEVEGLVKVFDQFSTAPDITKFITATDAVDGAIEITMDMIETDANINKAGTYDIVYTVKDSSGNVATLTVTITVNDKEAPKVEGKDLKTYAGTALSAADIIANFTATDNVDGAITLTEAMVKGLADVDFTKPGEYQVIIEVVDAAGNKTEHPVKISVREKGNTISVPDEVILDLAPLAPAAAEFCAVTEAEGEYKVEISAIGQWASANKMKFNPTVVQGETYVLRFTAKADKARSVQFNIGEAMDGTNTGVWMEKYPLAEEGTDVVALTTDYKTFDIMFTVQNEKFEWGPTIEFCVGPVAGACENGNNIYFTELAIYSVKEIGDVNLLHATVDPQHHIAGEGLVISKATNSGNWDWIAFKPEETDLEGYDKIVAKVYGPKDGVLLFKPNDLQPKETRYTMTGQWQEIEHALDFTLDASKQALVLMPDADVVGTGKYYLIASLELQGEGKDPINLLDATITKADVCTAQKAITLTKGAENAEQYDCAKFQVSDDLTGYAAVKYAIIGAPGFNTSATLKPNDNGSYQRQVTLDGTLQEGMIDLTGMEYNPAKSAMILFVDLLVNGTDNPVFILEMKYIVEKPAEPEPENPGHVEPVAVNQSSPAFASWEGLQTVTFTGLPATNAGSNGWARWDFDSVADKGYTDVVVKFKATPGLRICAKIDASATPTNNAYDALAGNKTTQVAGEDGLVTFTWNLAEFKATAEAAGKAFAVENIRKCVVFPSSGLEGDAALTTGSIELISIDFVKVEEEEVYVPVYPEAVADSIDLLTGTINPKTIQVAHQIRMMKKGGGQWNWVGLKTDADLTGYTKMVAEITGPAGAPFVFKINDKIEVAANGTGELAQVEWTAPEDFVWNAAAQTMIMFPDFNIAGLEHEFTITKLELQGEDKEPINLLLAKISVDANVKACRDLVLTKATNNTEQWDCIEITVPTDLTGATEVKYVVRGTQGDVLCIKPNNNADAESWIEMTGKAMEGTINFANATYNSNAPAMVVFPNIGAAGSGNPFIISQLVYVKPAPTLTHVAVSGAVDARLVLNEQTGLYEGNFALGTLWNTVNFAEKYSDGSSVALTFANATFSGDGIIGEKVGGAPYTAQLFADSDELVNAGGFCYSVEYKTNYKVTYNPETKAVTVNVVEPESELSKIQVGGDADAELVLNEATGLYEGQFTLAATWKRAHFDKVFADGSIFTLKYANTTFAGDGVLSAPAGAPWTAVLYSEGDSVAKGDFILSAEGPVTYYAYYNPQTKTMTISLTAIDTQAPVITINPTILAALAAKEFWEGADESATFSAFMQGITATDNVDGDIAVTLSMISLGGLNPSNLVAGDYTITITVVDEAGNQAKEEIKIHVKKYANENLLADLPNSKTDYKSSHWTYEQYQNDGTWKQLTSVQMRCREKPEGSGVWTTNMAVGAMPMKYIYANGSSLGVANKLTFNVWNDFAPVNVIQVKVILVAADGTLKYIVGGESDDQWFDVAKNIANVPQTIEFDAFEVKNIVFLAKSSGSGYIYFNNLKLTYEERGTAEHPYTVEQALSLGAKLSQSNYNTNGDVVEMWVKGFVVDQGTDAGDKSNNIKLASTANGETTLLIFTVNETESIKDVRQGDEVVIKGYLMNWSGTIEVSSTKVDGATVYPVFVSCTRGTNSITVSDNSSANATVKELSAESGLNGSEFTFKVEVANGFQLVSVKVNDEIIEAVEGVYTAKIAGPTSILVETIEAGAAIPQETTLEYKDSTKTTNMGAGNNAEIVNLDADLFTVTADKGSNSNYPGLNKALDIRIYKGNSMTIEIASGYTIKSIKINFLSGYAANAVVLVGGEAVSAEDGVYAINASSFVLKHSEASNDQVRFSSIVITYVESGEQPVSSPAAFQVTNLEAEGNARNHIEGAGAWIWIDPTSIGLTAENMAQFSVSATCESLNVVEAFFSDYSASAVRCYVVLSAAPAAEATTTINLTITHDDATYQGSVSFLGNELQ